MRAILRNTNSLRLFLRGVGWFIGFSLIAACQIEETGDPAGTVGGVSSDDTEHVVQDSKNSRIVVFVHGFTGDYKQTWGPFPKLLADDPQLDHFDVLLWGYPSSKFGRNPTIERIGAALKTELGLLDSRYRDVIIVGHSMGGLVVRSYVVNTLQQGRAQDLSPVRKILLFGVPNEGISVADTVPEFLNDQIADMQTASEFIVSLRESWINHVYRPEKEDDYNKSIPVVSVVGLEDYFVSETSVRTFFSDYQTTRGDHTTMVKPTNVNHPSYRIVRSELLKVSPKPYIRDQAKLNSVLAQINETLMRKAEFLLPAIDAYLEDPTEDNWKRVQWNSENNLTQVKNGINESLDYDSTAELFRLVSKGKQHSQTVFSETRENWNARGQILDEIARHDDPSKFEVLDWRNELVSIYAELKDELERLVNLSSI